MIITTSERKRKRVIELWNAGLKNPTAIGKKVKLAPNTVRNILREEGLLGPPQPRRTKQVRVSTADSSTQMNPGEQQPSPPQAPYRSEIDAGQFGRLIHELDDKNIKIEQQDKEIKELKKTNSQLTTDLESATTQVENLTTEKQVWTHEKKQLTDLLLIETREKQRLQRQLDDQIDYTQKITQTHQKEREQQKKKDALRNRQMMEMQRDYHESLQKLNDGVTKIQVALDDSNNQNKTLKERIKKLEENAEEQKVKQKKAGQKNTLISFGLGAGVGMAIGAVAYWAFEQLSPKHILSPPPPQRVVARKAVRCYPIPNNGINNRVTPETISSGASCSGSFSYNNGDNNTSG